MDDNCTFCDQTVTESQDAIECDGCRNWTHRICKTGKLNFFFSFNNFFFSFNKFLKTSILSYLLFYEISVVHFFLQLFFIGITPEAYNEAVGTGANIRWRCLACRGSEGAESSTILDQSMDKQVASVLHNELTIYDAPAQSTTVSLKPQGQIWTLFINSTTLLLSLEDTSKEILRLVELT